MTPLNNYILVKPDNKESETESGIVIAESAQKAVEKGEVIHAGTCDFVKKGDIIIFKDYSMEESEEYTFVKEDEILGKL